MTIIQWAKQGGRRYVQTSSPSMSALGQASTSVGQAPAGVTVFTTGTYAAHQTFVVMGI